MGLYEVQAQFDHFFRSYPDYGAHQAGYCINAGLEWLLDWMRDARFREEDVSYLRSQTGRTGEQLFADDFLAWLQEHGTFESIHLRAIPEGRVIHPNVPPDRRSGATVDGADSGDVVAQSPQLPHPYCY